MPDFGLCEMRSNSTLNHKQVTLFFFVTVSIHFSHPNASFFVKSYPRTQISLSSMHVIRIIVNKRIFSGLGNTSEKNYGWSMVVFMIYMTLKPCGAWCLELTQTVEVLVGHIFLHQILTAKMKNIKLHFLLYGFCKRGWAPKAPARAASFLRLHYFGIFRCF